MGEDVYCSHRLPGAGVGVALKGGIGVADSAVGVPGVCTPQIAGVLKQVPAQSCARIPVCAGLGPPTQENPALCCSGWVTKEIRGTLFSHEVRGHKRMAGKTAACLHSRSRICTPQGVVTLHPVMQRSGRAPAWCCCCRTAPCAPGAALSIITLPAASPARTSFMQASWCTERVVRLSEPLSRMPKLQDHTMLLSIPVMRRCLTDLRKAQITGL